MATVELARCPSCNGTGPVAAPCPERGCQHRGYHFVPESYAHKLAASGRGRVEPLVGQVVGDYLVADVLGVGGFGKVYLALQLPILRLKAALKLMETGHADPQMVSVMLEKFEGEAHALASLAHPNVVRLLKYGVHEMTPYLVMEYVADARTLKSDLDDKAARGERVEPEFMRHLLQQLVNGLDAAHRVGIVHRDIKPDNVMLQRVAGDDDFVRVLDFGLAKFVEERADTSMVMGTPAYMAPEQLTRKNIGPWTDLYAVGVIAFELLTGRSPFVGRTHQEIFAAKLDSSRCPTRRLDDLDVPGFVRDFLARALAYEPSDRFKTAGEMRAALNDLFARLEGALINPVDAGATWLGQDAGGNEAEVGPTMAVKSVTAQQTGRPDSRRAPVISTDLSPARRGQRGVLVGALAALLVAAISGGALLWGAATESSYVEVTGTTVAPPEVAAIAPAPEVSRPAEAIAESAPATIAGATAEEAPTEPTTPVEAAGTAGLRDPEDRHADSSALQRRADGGSPSALEPALADGPAAVVATDEPTPDRAPDPPVMTSVSSHPPGATVRVGGEIVGVTPVDVAWPTAAAPPIVNIDLPGYLPQEAQLSLDDAGANRTLTLEMAPQTSKPGSATKSTTRPKPKAAVKSRPRVFIH